MTVAAERSWRRRRIARLMFAATTIALVASGCAMRSALSPEPEAQEHMPGPAYVLLSAEPEVAGAPVPVAMTAPGRPDVRLAHIFEAGSVVRGDFVTSEGTYRLAALDGACDVALNLDADEEAQVVLTLLPGRACSLAVTWQGGVDAPDRPHAAPGVLITNHDAGNATPAIESVES